MTKIIHIIGLQGTGKSTLADAICKYKAAVGKTCINLVEECMHEAGQTIDVASARKGYRVPWTNASQLFDFLIVEHLNCTTINDQQPGDMVIHIQCIEANVGYGQ